MNTDFPFKVYDPEPEAKAYLEGFEPLVVVKGLLNQLQACRQTGIIERKQRDETIKELREALGDVMIIIENSPELWLIESQWNIIDKARKLLTE